MLKYSFERHKITKLKNHEEITVEELVDQYYKDADKYFEVNANKSMLPWVVEQLLLFPGTSIQPLENKNIKKESVSDEYFFDRKNRGKSQQIGQYWSILEYYPNCSRNLLPTPTTGIQEWVLD